MASAATRSLPRLARSARGYATQSNSNSSMLPIAGGVAALGIGAFFLLGGSESPPNLQKAEQAVAQAVKPSATDGTAASALDPKNFKSFKLKEVLPYNHDTSRFIFELPEGTDSGLTVASAVLTRSANPETLQDEGKPVIRPYTPITSPGTQGIMEFLIKKYDNGKMSKHIHQLKAGDELAIKGPIKKLQYQPNTWEHTAFIVGGSGFTPAWQVLQAIDSNKDDKTKALLIFANKTEKDILLRKELEEMKKRNPEKIDLLFVLDEASKGWAGEKGYVTPELLGKHLPPAGLKDKVKIFVCGPPPMMNSVSGNKESPAKQGALKGILADLGYTEDQVYKF